MGLAPDVLVERLVAKRFRGRRAAGAKGRRNGERGAGVEDLQDGLANTIEEFAPESPVNVCTGASNVEHGRHAPNRHGVGRAQGAGAPAEAAAADAARASPRPPATPPPPPPPPHPQLAFNECNLASQCLMSASTAATQFKQIMDANPNALLVSPSTAGDGTSWYKDFFAAW